MRSTESLQRSAICWLVWMEPGRSIQHLFYTLPHNDMVNNTWLMDLWLKRKFFLIIICQFMWHLHVLKCYQILPEAFVWYLKTEHWWINFDRSNATVTFLLWGCRDLVPYWGFLGAPLSVKTNKKESGLISHSFFWEQLFLLRYVTLLLWTWLVPGELYLFKKLFK